MSQAVPISDLVPSKVRGLTARPASSVKVLGAEPMHIVGTNYPPDRVLYFWTRGPALLADGSARLRFTCDIPPDLFDLIDGGRSIGLYGLGPGIGFPLRASAVAALARAAAVYLNEQAKERTNAKEAPGLFDVVMRSQLDQ